MLTQLPCFSPAGPSVCSSAWLLITGILDSLSTLSSTLLLCSFSLLLLTHFFFFFFFFWGGVFFFFYSVIASSVARGSSATASAPKAKYWIVSTLLSELQWISWLSKNPCAMRKNSQQQLNCLAESGKGAYFFLLSWRNPVLVGLDTTLCDRALHMGLNFCSIWSKDIFLCWIMRSDFKRKEWACMGSHGIAPSQFIIRVLSYEGWYLPFSLTLYFL